ncbi:bifunctional diaminohydroxyphosphoribosylaminopyrimidine deaminase/5-amino-6-(5-phosphoribosylamino)uracil reductase RibD [Bdellovibrio sp. HCB337]|uniref:bifunctional diaminohydroxyphosphoribosylaminopyrimidine deaminase/5-amino-6-(5-phosphoribosylamino)uracil reductase RibD n=1 Tax=Bdellovibrio sp. HCB337 TaxID=3394358 RepID=UPI0039A4ECF6
MKLSPEQSMQLAIDEAYKGATRVSPNPLVGAVVLDSEGNFLASGYHEFYGGPHAEVNALKNISMEQLQGATVFVTLEPCAHEGKTPSCAKMMAKLPLKKVIFGLVDPNPLVAGQGAAILQAAGIQTEVFSETHPGFKDTLEEVCEAFLWNFRQKKVFVSLKIAQSMDGQIGLKTGESKWITNETSREQAHYLRAAHDATLIGAGTLAADNPSLDIRHPQIQKKNKVVIVDPQGRLLKEASTLNLTRLHEASHLFWCVSEKSQEGGDVAFAKVLKVKELGGGLLDLQDLLLQLWNQGLRSVMIEGGAFTASQFLKAGLVNRLYLFQAPVIIGSGEGLSWTSAFGITEMKQRLVVKNLRTQNLAGDLLLTGRLS